MTYLNGITPPLKQDLEFLEHYGVMGMKWGVRKAAKAERKEWSGKAQSSGTANAVFQDAAKSFDKVLTKINNDPQFKGKDLNKDRKLRQQYDKVTETIFNQHLAQASVERTTNKAGDRAFVYQFDRLTSLMRPIEVKIVRQSEENDYPTFFATLNSLGQVSNFRFVIYEKDEVIQSDEEVDILVHTGDEFLEHYGVKGMKWGVRKKTMPGEIRGARKNIRREKASLKNQRTSIRAQKIPKSRRSAKLSTKK